MGDPQVICATACTKMAVTCSWTSINGLRQYQMTGPGGIKVGAARRSRTVTLHMILTSTSKCCRDLWINKCQAKSEGPQNCRRQRCTCGSWQACLQRDRVLAARFVPLYTLAIKMVLSQAPSNLKNDAVDMQMPSQESDEKIRLKEK